MGSEMCIRDSRCRYRSRPPSCRRGLESKRGASASGKLAAPRRRCWWRWQRRWWRQQLAALAAAAVPLDAQRYPQWMPSMQTPHLSLIAAGGSARGMPHRTAPPLQAVPMTLPSSSAPRPPHLLTLAVATPSAVPRILPSSSAGACCQRQVLQGHKREQCAVASATAATEARATAAAAAATTAIADATVNARVGTHAVLGAPRASCEWPRTGTCLTWTPTRAAPGAGTAGQLNLEPSQLQLQWLRHRPC